MRASRAGQLAEGQRCAIRASFLQESRFSDTGACSVTWTQLVARVNERQQHARGVPPWPWPRPY
eukprot:558259-Prymnesium_polylepis.1